ncbi:hypothetical protein H6758_04005 [Candidatus Nomurabacteria bacterium]|nr:hypothetical protein [Candidatus Nomurabacteria bacterium]
MRKMILIPSSANAKGIVLMLVNVIFMSMLSFEPPSMSLDQLALYAQLGVVLMIADGAMLMYYVCKQFTSMHLVDESEQPPTTEASTPTSNS